MASAVKEAVKETVLGSDDAAGPSSQSKARFTKMAVKDETGELYMGPEEFITAVAPEKEDFHKIRREQYMILFRVADRRGQGKVSLSDWHVFENILAKPLTMSQRLNSSLEDARQGMSQQLGSFGGRFAASEAEKAERNRKELMQKMEDKRQQQERDEFNKKYKGKN
ncbi:hypothetical protein NLG97_g8496 [Lecanicillium saksenae]|uniref:Uncharacterized protein n=1 Tax=Lecanicillium saksenae TaxID=468837 RepID=A0ACC1QKP4_9HYPO|nr:hypothetical protein NLG97_g8496 [Lecanicillium saksenae]